MKKVEKVKNGKNENSNAIATTKFGDQNFALKVQYYQVQNSIKKV